MADEKPTKRTTGRPLGPTGEAVRNNIRRIRGARGVSGADLSARMSELKRPIPPLGIQRIEAGARRVDVDDLVALAVALEVSPATLLLPDFDGPDEFVEVTGYPEPVMADRAWHWVGAAGPISEDVPMLDFVALAWPKFWRRAQVLTEKGWVRADGNDQ